MATESKRSDPDELIMRQVAMRRRDWGRAEVIAKSAKYPTSRSQVFPSVISDGLDVAEREQKEAVSNE